MIKRADASKISREKATKEQIAENFKRLAVDTDKKVHLKPSLLKIQKTLDGNTFGIIHENKTYYLKYTTKKGSTNPADFKHLDGLNSTFGIEKHNSFERAVNKMSFICEAQNNAHKLRLLLEKDEDIIDDVETSKPSADKKETKITSDEKEQDLIASLDKKETPPAESAPAADMSGIETPAEEPVAEPAAPEGGEETPAEEPVDTQPKGDSPKDIADELLGPEGIGGEETPAEEPAAAPEGGEETPAEEPAADTTVAPEEPAEEVDPKKAFQEAVGKLGQTINDLQDNEQFDEKDIKNAMNSLISAIGSEGFKMVGDKVIDSFIKKMKGSQEKIDTEETPAEQPAEEESIEKLDENLLRDLKIESKRLLKEQLQQEIEKRKRNILIENIKRKLI